MFLPLDQHFIEIISHLLLPNEPSGIGTERHGGYVAAQQFVNRGPSHRRSAGAGYPNHHWVGFHRVCGGHSSTARIVNNRRTIDITLLYWKSGDRNLDRSSALSSPFSPASRVTAIAQPMK